MRLLLPLMVLDFRGGSVSKESPCSVWSRFDPGLGKIRWRREWPTPVFLPGESQGKRSLMGYSPQGCTESDMTEWLTHSRWQCQGGYSVFFVLGMPRTWSNYVMQCSPFLINFIFWEVLREALLFLKNWCVFFTQNENDEKIVSFLSSCQGAKPNVKLDFTMLPTWACEVCVFIFYFPAPWLLTFNSQG